jgi:hypothetical protein
MQTQSRCGGLCNNVILNAVKYTREGGITVRWGDSAANDPKRWELCFVETGPRHAESSKPIAEALEKVISETPGSVCRPISPQRDIRSK